MLRESFMNFIEQVTTLIAPDKIIWVFAFVVLFVTAVIYFGKALYYMKKRNLESFHFTMFCIPAIGWPLFLVLPTLVRFIVEVRTLFEILAYASYIFIPALLCLHIWSQVSYKPITVIAWLRYMVLPLILVGLKVLHIMKPELNTLLIADTSLSVENILTVIYYIFALAKSYLLCFNVFYQMPKHMRQSTYKLITSVTAIMIAKISGVFFPADYATMLNVIALIYSIRNMFSAYYIASSSNVILTSREFVFGNLSTIVLIVSRKGRILEWNRKDDDAFDSLPKPKYKQGFQDYRDQILLETNGIVSPHDDKIITTTKDNEERHYLFTQSEIRYGTRLFGYLIEISEVTKIYSVVRFLEDIAMVDQLTGIYNRNAYINQVKHTITAKDLPLTILVGDVNNLKKVNDTIGHLAGDRLLITVCDIVKKNAPKNAFVARIGGDEIVVLVSNSNVEEAQAFISRMDAGTAAVYDEDFKVPSISWGYAVMSTVQEDYNSVFLKADGMMYEQKQRTKIISRSGLVPAISAKQEPKPVKPTYTQATDISDEMDAPAASAATAASGEQIESTDDTTSYAPFATTAPTATAASGEQAESTESAKQAADTTSYAPFATAVPTAPTTPAASAYAPTAPTVSAPIAPTASIAPTGQSAPTATPAPPATPSPTYAPPTAPTAPIGQSAPIAPTYAPPAAPTVSAPIAPTYAPIAPASPTTPAAPIGQSAPTVPTYAPIAPIATPAPPAPTGQSAPAYAPTAPASSATPTAPTAPIAPSPYPPPSGSAPISPSAAAPQYTQKITPPPVPATSGSDLDGVFNIRQTASAPIPTAPTVAPPSAYTTPAPIHHDPNSAE